MRRILFVALSLFFVAAMPQPASARDIDDVCHRYCGAEYEKWRDAKDKLSAIEERGKQTQARRNAVGEDLNKAEKVYNAKNGECFGLQQAWEKLLKDGGVGGEGVQPARDKMDRCHDELDKTITQKRDLQKQADDLDGTLVHNAKKRDQAQKAADAAQDAYERCKESCRKDPKKQEKIPDSVLDDLGPLTPNNPPKTVSQITPEAVPTETIDSEPAPHTQEKATEKAEDPGLPLPPPRTPHKTPEAPRCKECSDLLNQEVTEAEKVLDEAEAIQRDQEREYNRVLGERSNKGEGLRQNNEELKSLRQEARTLAGDRKNGRRLADNAKLSEDDKEDMRTREDAALVKISELEKENAELERLLKLLEKDVKQTRDLLEKAKQRSKDAQKRYDKALQDLVECNQHRCVGKKELKKCPKPPANKPMQVGSNGDVGSGARMKDKAVSTVGGLLGGLLQSATSGHNMGVGRNHANRMGQDHSRSDDSGAPPTESSPFADSDKRAFKDALGNEVAMAGKFVDGQLVIGTDINESPDSGTFQTVFLENADGERLPAPRCALYELYRDWKLTVWWTKDHYVNGEHVSHDAGGWEKTGRDSFGTFPALVDGHAGLWNEFGFGNASNGAKSIGCSFPVQPDDLDKEPIDVVVHITRPGEDPVVTAPFIFRLKPRSDDVLDFVQEDHTMAAEACVEEDISEPVALPAQSLPPAADPDAAVPCDNGNCEEEAKALKDADAKRGKADDRMLGARDDELNAHNAYGDAEDARLDAEQAVADAQKEFDSQRVRLGGDEADKNDASDTQAVKMMKVKYQILKGQLDKAKKELDRATRAAKKAQAKRDKAEQELKDATAASRAAWDEYNTAKAALEACRKKQCPSA